MIEMEIMAVQHPSPKHSSLSARSRNVLMLFAVPPVTDEMLEDVVGGMNEWKVNVFQI